MRQMSLKSFGKAQPGYTLTVSTSPEHAVQVLTEAYIASGFRGKSAPAVFPIKLAYSSVGASLCIEALSSVVPVFLIPAVFRKMLPMTVRIRALSDSAGAPTLRVDMDTLSFQEFAFPIFDSAFRRGITSLAEQGISVEVGPLTDSALERRTRRKNR